MAEATGVRFSEPGCPWESFDDPVCQDVLEAMRWWETGQIATLLGANPHHHLLAGISIFRRALAAVRDFDEERKAERDKDR